MTTFRHIFLIALLAFNLNVFAKDFIEFPANDFPIGESLPTFATQIKIGHTPTGDVTFRLDYPEYKKLTAAEISTIKKNGLKAPAEIELHTTLAISRKEYYADIWFSPIVCRNGEWLRLVSAKITPVVSAEAKGGFAAPKAGFASPKAPRYTEKSVLSEGKWLKIKVEKEGLYELTATQLAEHGFSDINRVKIYGYGGRILEQNLKFDGITSVTDDLEEVATIRKQKSILFFAEGTIRWTYQRKWIHQQNTYSKYSYYFVTEGENPLEIQSVSANISTKDTLSSITHNAVLDNDAFGWYAGGNRLFDSYEFRNGSSNSYKLATPDIESWNGSVQIGFSGASTTSYTYAAATLNNTSLGTMSMASIASNESARETETAYNVTNLEENNTFKFEVTTSGTARLDFIRVSYTRTLKGSAEAFSFTPNKKGMTVLSIADATANTKLWRIAYAGNPTLEMKGALNGKTLTVPIEDASLRYVIADISKSYPAPEIVGTVANQNLHADKNIDMVIIIPESGILEAEAQRLAAVHSELQNLRMRIVRTDQIYNEFSSGTPDATAYRRYMKMLYDRAENIEDAPKYLLLFGDGAWDNRMITKEWKDYSPEDFLLCYENCEKINDYTISIGSLYSYVTDDYFGLLDDGEGANINREKIDLGIGRFPVHTPEDAKILVDKTISYLKNEVVGTWKNTVCIMGDNGDGNEHMEDAEKAFSTIEETTDGKMDITRMYWDAYPRTISALGYSFPEASTRLKEIVKNGAILFNYSGHGSPDQLSHSRLITTEDFRELANAKMAMWILASCEITPYDELSDNIGRATLINEKGGSVAMFCASRAVYASYNRRINTAISKYLLSYDENTGKRYTMGDAVRMAKVDMIYDASRPSPNIDHTMNKLKYALLGDPAVTLSIPTGNIIIDSINGEAVTPGLLKNLAAGSKAVFSGHVAKRGATEVDETFSGILTATLYDCAETVTCKNHDKSADKPMTYTGYTNAVAISSDSVSDGRFSVTLPVPVDISYSSAAARLSLYAVSNDHTVENNGFCSDFCLKGTAPSVSADKAGPTVHLYLDEPDFPSGGTVGTSALFVANLQDESGINAPLQNVGHDMELTLDENANTYFILNQNFTYDFGSITSGTVSYPLENLTPGKHELRFRVWDTAGNSTTKQLNFIVSEDYKANKFDITSTKSPASVSTRFVTTVPTPAEGASVTFEVYDFSGAPVWSYTSSSAAATRYFSTEWNLTNNSGAPVPGGVYLYRATLHSPTGNKETKAKKIIVVKQ